MKDFTKILALSTLVVITLTSFKIKTETDNKPDDAATLYDTIVAMDTKWEDAYNHCKLDVMNELISEDLEFYHDRGGLMTSKQKLNDALKDNICGKVTRELKKGSIEVYAIPGYGAVEMGLHGFHNNQEPSAQIHFAKFVHLWKRENGKWRITRVISLH